MSEIFKGFVVLFVGLLNLVLGFIVLSKNPKKIINQSFAAICLSFIIWCTTLFLYQYPYFGNSLFWIQMVYMAAVMYMSSTLHFSFVFPTVNFPKAWIFAKIYTVFYILFSVWLMFFTKWWVVGVINDPIHGLQTILDTTGYIIWIVATWVNFSWIAINFILKGKTATGYQKQQINYLWIGYILFGIAVTVSDGIIPLVWHDTSYFYISAATNLFFSGLVGYIILKQRFMDIRLLIARSISYSLLLLILASTYIGGLLTLSSKFINFEPSPENLTILTLMSLIMAYTFQPLRKWLEKTTDKVFFKESYDTETLLNKLSRTMATSLTLSELTRQVLTILTHDLRLTKTSFAITTDESLKIIEDIYNNSHMAITRDDVKYMAKEEKILILDEIPEGIVKELMRGNDIYTAVPLYTKQFFIGFLFLGSKSSGEIFFNQDINFLSILGPQLSVALQNAQSYEKINQFNVTLQDEVKKATADLQSANEKLTKLDKVKDEFISIASHDLRSPMATVKNYIWLAKDEIASSPDKAREDLDIALESTEHGISLVSDMLDVSRIEAHRIELNPGSLDIKHETELIIEELKKQADDKHISLTIKTDGEIIAFADEERVHQVLTNLVGNAIKFTQENGSVNITSIAREHFVEISITDTGVGINKEDVGKLFTKFGKLENGTVIPSSQGTGLGLYISKNIVELSGGKIWVESTPEVGSKFIFTLPIV